MTAQRCVANVGLSRQKKIGKMDFLKKLKDAWRKKYAPDSRNPSELLDDFRSFVRSCCGGDFPIEDVSCWLRVTYDKCMNHIQSAKGTDGVSPDVRFDE